METGGSHMRWCGACVLTRPVIHVAVSVVLPVRSFPLAACMGGTRPQPPPQEAPGGNRGIAVALVRRLREDEACDSCRGVSSTTCPLVSTRGLHGWDLPATAACRDRVAPLFDRHIGQWCNQYLLVQPEQMRAISLGKAPLQRKHFERKRLEHDRHSRAGSLGKAPLQRQHFERYLVAQDEHSRATS